MDIKGLVKKHHEMVVGWRRYFHTYPELSGEEFNTQKKIIEECTKLGLNPRKAAGTGVIAELTGKFPGKTIALRADMDALALQDECEQPYRSQNQGVCHACGHDGHTAMLLGVAQVLTDLQDGLPGKVRFLFQPSEEKLPGGAQALVNDGALEGVDAILGAHLWQPLQVGTVGTSYDRLMAAPDQFTIRISGRGGHGSMPQQTVEALLAGAQVVLGLNTIISRNIDAMENAVLSVGAFQSGEVFNIIPDTAIIKGTVRSFDQQVREIIFNRIEQITKGICEAAGADYEIDKVFGFPPVINDCDLTKQVVNVAKKVVGENNVLLMKPSMAGEDFSCFQQHVPGAFIFVGVGNEEKGIIYPQHHPKYDIDETALQYGVEVMASAALSLLK